MISARNRFDFHMQSKLVQGKLYSITFDSTFDNCKKEMVIIEKIETPFSPFFIRLLLFWY